MKEQGIEREAGIHLGYAANEMAQRGAQSDRMDALRQVIARNDIRVEMKNIDREVAQLERAEKAKTRDAAPPPVPEKMDLKSERQAVPPPRQAEQAKPAPTVARARPEAREAFRGKEPTRATQGAARAVGGVAGGATKIAAKALDGLASAFESLFGGGSAKTSEQRPEPIPTDGRAGTARGPCTAATQSGASATRAGASVSADAPCGQGESFCRGGAAGTRGASPRIVARLWARGAAGKRTRRGD